MNASPAASAQPSSTSTSTSTSTVSTRVAAAGVVGVIRHLLDAESTSALLSGLDEAVRTYEVEFRRYLNGQGQRPPLELGAVLTTAFLALAGADLRSSTTGFRIDALEARFHAARRLLTQRLDRADRRVPMRLARTA